PRQMSCRAPATRGARSPRRRRSYTVETSRHSLKLISSTGTHHEFLPVFHRPCSHWSPFAMSGLSKLAAYGPTTEKIAGVGLPLPPLAFAVAVAVELGGGLLLVLGYRVLPVALTLAAFSLATAVSFHRNFADQNQMIHFLKNVMMAGGAAANRRLRGRSDQH